jgi:hypothetical protein
MCALAQDSFSQDQNFPERNLLQRAFSTLVELLRFCEGGCSSLALISAGTTKNPEKCSPGNPAPKSIRESEVRLL